MTTRAAVSGASVRTAGARVANGLCAPVRRSEQRRETENIVWGMVDVEPARLSPIVAARPRPARQTARRRTRAVSRDKQGARLALPRYLATWTDGVTRVIHAPTRAAASELAARLEVADDVFVVSVKALP